MTKLVILTNGNYFARLIVEPLLNSYRNDVVGILIVTGDYKGRHGIKMLKELAQVTAFPYLLYKIVTACTFSFAQLIFRNSLLSVENCARKLSVPIHKVVSIKTDDAYSWIKNLQPQLIISVSCPQRIPNIILDVATQGGINIHSSMLPEYAGLAPYYWVLSKGEHFTGTTVHYMTSQFDKGNVLVQKTLEINSGESAFNLFVRLAQIGGETLLHAVPMALNRDAGKPQNHANYSYYSNPSMQSYCDLKQHGHVTFRIKEVLAVISREVRSAAT
jgi:folate-dependent phosphoribosylglycinamide formyltransferase PurN